MPNLKKTIGSPEEFRKELWFEIYGIVIFTFSVIGLASYGAIGRNITYLSRFFVGTFDFIIPLFGIAFAIYIMVRRHWPNHWSPRLSGLTLIFLALLIYVHMQSFAAFDHSQKGQIIQTTWNLLLKERAASLPTDIGSGIIGGLGYASLHFLFEDTGTLIMLGAFVLAGFLLATGFSYVQYIGSLKEKWKRLKRFIKLQLSNYLHKNYQQKRIRSMEHIEEEDEVIQPPQQSIATTTVKPVIHDYTANDHIIADEQLSLSINNLEKNKEEEEIISTDIQVKFQSSKDMSKYKLPSLYLLDKPKKKNVQDKESLGKKSQILTNTLNSFGVHALVKDIHVGPAVTRYEVQPDVGVKVSRIVNLADDIALALAAKDIRIEAPIPGKSVVGIEVPNHEVSMICLRELLEDPAFEKSTSPVSISLGRAISGDPIIADLTKMPHLLVAGATGSGKSVCINSIIISLLYKSRPDEVKIMMIDPKMVELNIYNGIPHLLVPVVTDPKRASIALKKVVQEMEKRYEMFAKEGARDIERYNAIIKSNEEKEKLPYIVVMIDELADLMMVAPADVEDAICRLAQMARAAGIHLIIATQRPSVDVITGVIKANIPSRIAFAVSSQADSRTILDIGGADKLLGRGDMLYLPVGAAKPIRVQGCYLTDSEVEKIVGFVKKQQEVNYNEEMIPVQNDTPIIDEMSDELYPQAVKLVVEAKTASVSFLQRRMRIGYTRAARLMDMMESAGVVGPYEGSKPRDVLLTIEEFAEKKSSQTG